MRTLILVEDGDNLVQVADLGNTSIKEARKQIEDSPEKWDLTKVYHLVREFDTFGKATVETQYVVWADQTGGDDD